jgi:quercetin dioxygenase-like cupin family protein
MQLEAPSEISQALALTDAEKPSVEQMRAKILKLEAQMLSMAEHAVELPVDNHFAPGIYMRALHIPKGTTLTGAIHKTEHMNILSQGEMTVWTEDGMKRLKASTVIKSMPGIKRVGFAHEDSVWITVHLNPTEERDPEKLVEMLTVKTFEELPEFTELKQIPGGT